MDIWDWMPATKIAVCILCAIVTVIVSIVYIKKHYHKHSAAKGEKFLDIATVTALRVLMTAMGVFRTIKKKI